ncbi:uncharacterized protein HLK63_G03817 [Nakaseomyces glabratus]|nr:uncharacterized protein GW608_G03817 [Nakaseomyces glabratus]UCS25737.1 uncharacterized protein HLK63_G03817 [Nakaseomyces glabratus]UCS30967.1 uncharacterized protein HLK64_G03817 [Nakaseomyces glabratus]UCS36196.1 uncharacterized protein HLK62_G03817 [Nakaseomyces glabratus]
MPLLVYKILFSTELCYAPRCDWEYLSQPFHTRKPTFSVLWDSRAILGEERGHKSNRIRFNIFNNLPFHRSRGLSFGLYIRTWSYEIVRVWVYVYITYNLQII